MKVLLIGGTGTISLSVTRLLQRQGHEVTLFNRGTRTAELPEGVETVTVDIGDEAAVARALSGRYFDAAADFIAFVPAQIERDYRLLSGKVGQYVFISSASAYQKPLADYRITEGTPLCNPYWQYSRDKIACEDALMRHAREDGFPATIVRPSHTYDERSVPLGLHGVNGSWQVIERMRRGKPVLIHGDGSSLWTMTHAEDFAAAFVGLLGNVHARGEVVQITSDESLTWNQIYAEIAAALGVPLVSRYVSSAFLAACAPSGCDFTGGLLGDKACTVAFDNAKLKRLVPGFTAKIRFDEGVRRTIANVLSHPELQKPDPAFDAWCDRVTAAQDAALAAVRAAAEA